MKATKKVMNQDKDVEEIVIKQHSANKVVRFKDSGINVEK